MIILRHPTEKFLNHNILGIFPFTLHVYSKLLKTKFPTGTTQRDGTGREEGGGFRMGKRVYLWRIHVDVWQNQYNIVK